MDDEDKRLNYLHNLNILDTSFDINFDRITTLLQIILDVPIVLISFVDYNRQWFKSCIGLDMRETDRELSFCSDAIKQNDIYIINDAKIHPLYNNNSFVLHDPKIRFYAGKPICKDGYNLGTLCIIDKVVRQLNKKEKEILEIFTKLVENEIDQFHYIKKIKEYEENIKNLSAIISHDLINTIFPIVSLSKMILQYNDLLNIDNISLIESSASNALALSSSLLDHYKLELNQLTITKKNVFIPEFIKKYSINKLLTISNICNDYIFIDTLRIDQVLYNLISNAEEYSNGKIILNIEKNCNSFFIFSVEDNGLGIPLEKRQLLFKKFSQNIHPTITRSRPRTGLGLYICKNIIELHGGKIWIENSSKFCFSIPLS